MQAKEGSGGKGEGRISRRGKRIRRKGGGEKGDQEKGKGKNWRRREEWAKRRERGISER